MTAPTDAASPIAESTAPDADTTAAIAAARADLVSEEFKRGARAAAESMKYYFLDENEFPIYDVPSSDLDTFADGAVYGVIYDEGLRVDNGRPIV